MPALNFKKQFAPKVESGEKHQTIRAERKGPFQIGDKLYLYTGMRTKSCRKLGEAVCKNVLPIKIHEQPLNVKVNFGSLRYDDILRLAQQDGFDNVIDFIAFFRETHGLPFKGQLIQW